MRIISSFFLAILISLSSWATTCSRCQQEYDDIRTHICMTGNFFDADYFFESEEDEELYLSRKRNPDDCDDDNTEHKKRRLNPNLYTWREPLLFPLDRELISAVAQYNPFWIDNLIKEGANINAVDEDGSVLHHAIKNLKEAMRATDTEIPLFVVENLVEQGANVMDSIFRGDFHILLWAQSFLDKITTETVTQMV